MKKVAVFGNTGGGKSTLARKLAAVTGLPLHPIDLIQFRPAGGGKIPHADYLAAHAELIGRDAWIIDGFGCAASSLARFAAADTLVYVDLPLATHYWWVTKRLLRAPFVAPEGWPEKSPIWSSTRDSLRVVRLYHRDMTPRYRQLVADATGTKRVHHLRSPRALRAFVAQVEAEQRAL
jgi:adenylate kinase family enzyme